MVYSILSVFLLNSAISLLIAKGKDISIYKKLLFIALIIACFFIHARILRRFIPKEECVPVIALTIGIVMGYYFIRLFLKIFGTLISALNFDIDFSKVNRLFILAFVSILISLTQIILIIKFSS